MVLKFVCCYALQDLSHPDVSEYTRQSWPFYSTMQAVVGALPLSQVLTKKGNVHRCIYSVQYN